MGASKRKLLIIQAAGLGHDFLVRQGRAEWHGLTFRPIQSVLPAVTCTVQATFRTATPPSAHGMVANGLFFRELRRPMFWEQASALVDGPRIWDGYRAAGGRVALLFWQQSLGESVDLVLSPAPIHKHGGGLVPACYEKPEGLYDRLCRVVGGRFSLMRYWGPLASAKASDWIAAATAGLLSEPDAPGLCFTYLPALDYDLQRHGPDSAAGGRALVCLLAELDLLLAAAERQGYDVMIFGDYAIAPVTHGAAFPNRALREAGLLRTRAIEGRLYPDFHASLAFAVVDHEVAHVYAQGAAGRERAAEVLRALPGVERVLEGESLRSAGLGHARSGELVLVAREGGWFAYPWWIDDGQAPDYARHVDIHNKPGYDPCELFGKLCVGWPPVAVSGDTTRIRGSHGRVGPGRAAAWASTFELSSNPATLTDLAAAIRAYLG